MNWRFYFEGIMNALSQATPMALDMLEKAIQEEKEMRAQERIQNAAFQVIYWNSNASEEDAETEGFENRGDAYSRLMDICIKNPGFVGYVFSTCGNRRIMTIGVGLE